MEKGPLTHCFLASCMHACMFSHVRLFVTPWTAARQARVCGTSQARILEWVAIPSLPRRDLPNPGIEPMPPAPPAGRSFTTEPHGKPLSFIQVMRIY